MQTAIQICTGIFLISIILISITYLFKESFFAIFSILNSGKKVKGSEKSTRFNVAFVIPTYNEELVIESTIERIMSLDYPSEKTRIVIAENGSTDKTVEIVERMIQKYPDNVKMVTTDRPNKLLALEIGSLAADADVLAYCDADIHPDPDCINKAAAYFEDEKVGAITSMRRPLYRNMLSKLAALRELYYSVRLAAYSFVDSTPWVSMSPAFFRKSIMEKMFTDPKRRTDWGADDLYIAVEARKQGYKVLYANDVQGDAGIVSNVSDFWKRHVRGSQNVAQAVLTGYHKTLLNSSYGLYGLFSVPLKCAAYIICSVFLPLIWIFALPAAIFSSLDFLTCVFVLYTALFVPAAYNTLAIRFALKQDIKPFIFPTILYPIFYFVSESVEAVGAWRWTLGIPMGWEKSTSDRDLSKK